MRFAVRQLAADADQNTAPSSGDRPLAPFGVQIRVALQQGFAVHKVDLFRQERSQTMLAADFRLCRLDGGVNAAHGAFQVVQLRSPSPITLPVPLIDVHRVDRRQAIFIRAQRLHMGGTGLRRRRNRSYLVLRFHFASECTTSKVASGRVLTPTCTAFAAGEVILRAIAQTAEDRGLHFDQTELLLQLAGEEGFDLG